MPKLWKTLAVVLVVPVAAGGVTALTAPAQAAVTVPAKFGFAGGGWGHGVGMSQVGAYGMASEGKSASQILTHFYTGTTVGAYADGQDMQVNLRHRVSSLKMRTEALASGGGAVSIDLGSGVKVDGKAGDTFTMKVSGTKLVVAKNGTNVGTTSTASVRWSGTRYPSTTTADNSVASVLNLVGSTTSSFTTAGHRYRYGSVTVSARAVSGVTKLEAVNSVRLHDEYLRGLGEVPSSWPAAALQAQVVAARSFALVKYAAGLRGSCLCHVYSNTTDQNFVGYSKESSSYGASWRAAVTATNLTATTSKTVLYKGKPAQAFYSASTGGRTQNVKDVWGSSIPYLVSVDDHWSTSKRYNPTYASWGPYERTQAKVAAAFGLSDVKAVDLSQRYASGALKSATAVSSAGKRATLPVSSLVARLTLTSNWVKSVSGGGSVAKAAPAAYKKYPLKATKAKKVRYFGYPAAHKNLAKSRVVNGGTKKNHSADVKSIQTWLKGLGYLKSKPDGKFGKSTATAVKKFQKAKHQKQSGLVGGGAKGTTGTWKALQVAYRNR
jgi:SpoIID/LytB domain protein